MLAMSSTAISSMMLSQASIGSDKTLMAMFVRIDEKRRAERFAEKQGRILKIGFR